MIRTKTTRKPRATQFRRSRRHASAQGLRPSIAAPCSSAASSEAVSSVKSVASWVAIRESGGAASTPPPGPPLLHADRAEVPRVQDVVHIADVRCRNDVLVEENC